MGPSLIGKLIPTCCSLKIAVESFFLEKLSGTAFTSLFDTTKLSLTPSLEFLIFSLRVLINSACISLTKSIKVLVGVSTSPFFQAPSFSIC